MLQIVKRWTMYVAIFIVAMLLTDQYREYRQFQEFETVRQELIQQEKKQQQEHKDQERKCLKNALYYEARSEGQKGIVAVASVIENRKNHKDYPNSYCGIINQRKQFSYTLLRKPDVETIEGRLKSSDKVAYGYVSEVANNMVDGHFKPVLPSGVVNYATKEITNAWIKTKKIYATIGNHHFYKE